MKIKNLTYANLVRVIRQLEKKGYDLTESDKIARRLFAELNPSGKSMQEMIAEILPKDEYLREYAR